MENFCFGWLLYGTAQFERVPLWPFSGRAPSQEVSGRRGPKGLMFSSSSAFLMWWEQAQSGTGKCQSRDKTGYLSQFKGIWIRVIIKHITSSQDLILNLASAGRKRGHGGRAQGVKMRNRRLNETLCSCGHLGDIFLSGDLGERRILSRPFQE